MKKSTGVPTRSLTTQNSRKVRLGFIGCGVISQLHYEAVLENQEIVELVAICDLNEVTLKKRQREWNVKKAYTNYKEMLNDESVDAVEILLVTPLHRKIAIDAIRKGKSVSIQKPMANDLKQADEIIKEYEKYKLLATKNPSLNQHLVAKVCDNFVLYPPVALAKKMMDEGAIGELVSIRTNFISGGTGGWDVPQSAWKWRTKEIQKGRPIQTFDHGHHLYALFYYLAGEFYKVKSWILFKDQLLDCPASIMIRFKSEFCLGSVNYTHSKDIKVSSKYYSNDEWFQIQGTKGIILINQCSGMLYGTKKPVFEFYNGLKWKSFTPKKDWKYGFAEMTKDFALAILEKRKPIFSLFDARKVLKYSIAIQLSSKLGREVYVDELEKWFPTLYFYLERRRERKRLENKDGWIKWFFSLFVNYHKFASQSHELLMKLPQRLKKGTDKKMNMVCSVILIHPKTKKISNYGVFVSNGVASVKNEKPTNPLFTMKTDNGTMAALLLGKTKVLKCWIQGKISMSGDSHLALKFVNVFQLK